MCAPPLSRGRYCCIDINFARYCCININFAFLQQQNSINYIRKLSHWAFFSPVHAPSYVSQTCTLSQTCTASVVTHRCHRLEPVLSPNKPPNKTRETTEQRTQDNRPGTSATYKHERHRRAEKSLLPSVVLPGRSAKRRFFVASICENRVFSTKRHTTLAEQVTPI